jgi:peptidoglycan/LPS O-acetylase OafA/YrhL
MSARRKASTSRRIDRNPDARVGGHSGARRVAVAAVAAVGLPLGIYTPARFCRAPFLLTDVNLCFTGLVVRIILTGSVPAPTALMRLRPLCWCGDLSYCFHIIHFLVFNI